MRALRAGPEPGTAGAPPAPPEVLLATGVAAPLIAVPAKDALRCLHSRAVPVRETPVPAPEGTAARARWCRGVLVLRYRCAGQPAERAPVARGVGLAWGQFAV